MAMFECPSISETTLGLTFSESKSVAHVCLRSWKRKCGRPALEQRLEPARGEVAAVERRARLGGEHEPVLVPQGAGPIYLPQLALQGALEGFRGRTRQAHAPAAALGLGGDQLGASLRRGQGAPYLKRPGFEVDVVPLEPEQLALPEPGVDGEHVEGFEAVSAGRVEQHLDLPWG